MITDHSSSEITVQLQRNGARPRLWYYHSSSEITVQLQLLVKVILDSVDHSSSEITVQLQPWNASHTA